MLEKYQNKNRIDQVLLESYQVFSFKHFINYALNNDIDDFDDYKYDIELILNSHNDIQCIFSNNDIDYVLFYNDTDEENAYVYNDYNKSIESLDSVDLGFMLDNTILNGIDIKYIHKDFMEYLESNDYLDDNLKRIEFNDDSFKMFSEC